MDYNFFLPEMRVTLGPYTLQAGIHFEVYSSKENPIDWAVVRFTDVMPPALKLAKKDALVIELGYNSAYDVIFTGNVQAIEGPEIRAKDKMQLMKDAVITGVFLQATPQDILRSGLGVAGIAGAKLSTESFSRKPRVMIRSMDGLALAAEINRIWGLKHQATIDATGAYNWAGVVEQAKVYTFSYGQNIIDLERQDGYLVLQTIAAGFIRHSHKINVVHPDATGTFEALKVRYYVTSSGFPRTEIWFKEAA